VSHIGVGCAMIRAHVIDLHKRRRKYVE